MTTRWRIPQMLALLVLLSGLLVGISASTSYADPLFKRETEVMRGWNDCGSSAEAWLQVTTYGWTKGEASNGYAEWTEYYWDTDYFYLGADYVWFRITADQIDYSHTYSYCRR